MKKELDDKKAETGPLSFNISQVFKKRGESISEKEREGKVIKDSYFLAYFRNHSKKIYTQKVNGSFQDARFLQ